MDADMVHVGEEALSTFTYAELDRTEVDGDDSKFVLYWFRVRHGDKSWLIGRRYSQFNELLAKLTAHDPALVKHLRLNLPPKRFLGNQKSELVTIRSFALLNFINSMGRSPEALKVPFVGHFLELPEDLKGTSAFTRAIGKPVCLHEGYLRKRRDHRHSQWPLRFFCLTTRDVASVVVPALANASPPGSAPSQREAMVDLSRQLVLLYYDAKETIPSTPKGVIDLSYIAGEPSPCDMMDGDKPRKFCFRILTGKSETFLQASNDNEVGVWLAALNNPIITGLDRAKAIVSKTVKVGKQQSSSSGSSAS